MLSRFSHVRLFGTPWTVARQTPLSMGLSRQEYWSGLLCPPPGGSSQPRDRTRVSYVSYIGRRVLCHSCHLGSPMGLLLSFNKRPDVDRWDSRVSSCPTEATKDQTLPVSSPPSSLCWLPLLSQVVMHTFCSHMAEPEQEGKCWDKGLSLTLSTVLLRRRFFIFPVCQQENLFSIPSKKKGQ